MEIKILFTGSVGAGKSSAIESLSDIPVIKTEAKATDAVSASKETTTVAFDYGEFALDDGQKIKLFGTPGQIRFSYMWEILQKNALGLVVLVNNETDDPLAELDLYLSEFAELIERTSAVIGVTHLDKQNGPTMEDYYSYMQQRNIFHPLFPLDARNPDDVKVLIEAMVAVLQVA